MTQHDTQPVTLDGMTLSELVQRNAACHGSRIAFRDDRGVRSYAEFGRRVAAFDQGLAALGVGRGDRVAVLSRNRTEYVEICCATGNGSIAVPLNWRLSPSELGNLLAQVRPKLLICETEFIDQQAVPDDAVHAVPVRMTFDERRAGWHSYEALIAEYYDAPSPSSSPPQSPDPACIVFTSGTTGQPKGAILTHAGLLENAADVANILLRLNEGDVAAAVMPMFHVGGFWYHLFPCFAAGVPVVIETHFDPSRLVATIKREQVSVVHLVPTMVADLLATEGSDDLPSLRTLFYAASPMPLPLLKRAMAQMPSCGFVQSYGSTEAGTITVLSADDHIMPDAVDHWAPLQSCGRPFPGVAVRVVCPEGQVLPIHHIGEIQVRSDKTMQGYWENPKATAATMQNGWLTTGDLGYLDDAGRVYIVDRKSDMIITGGENVYPSEVEQVLMDIPGLREVVVLGMPDPRWIEKVVACVVVDENGSVDAETVHAFARERLARYKCPKDVFFLDDFPKSGAGKVLRGQLRKMLTSGDQENAEMREVS